MSYIRQSYSKIIIAGILHVSFLHLKHFIVGEASPRCPSREKSLMTKGCSGDAAPTMNTFGSQCQMQADAM